MSWTAESAWRLLRDVLLTLTGLALIVQQSVMAHPHEMLIIAGLALNGIGASFHVRSLMGASFGMPASQPPSSPSSSSPPPLPPGEGDHAHHD